MATKTKPLSTNNQPDLEEPISFLFPNVSEGRDPEIEWAAKTRAEIIEILGDKAIELLGTSKDYAISYGELEPIHGELFPKSVFIAPKPGSEHAMNIVGYTIGALYGPNLTVGDCETVISGLIDRIKKECGVKIRYVRDTKDEETIGFLMEHGNDTVSASEKLFHSGTKIKYPEIVRRVFLGLKVVETEYIASKTKEEIASLHPADQLIEVKRRKKARPRHAQAYDYIRGEIEEEIELLKERKTIFESTKVDYPVPTADGCEEYDPQKRGLTRQLAMMLLDELFPNLKSASNMAKGQFLQFLTGLDADGLRIKWSDYQRGNRESLEADMKKVAEWKRKLKISD